MEKTRAELIHEQILILAEAYGLPISEARQQIYVEALIDLAPETVRAAVGHIIRTRSFAGNLPTVAEIREAATGGESVDTQIALAWDKLIYAVERHGYYDSIQFDDPVITMIVRSWGGWIKWSGEVKTDELKWARKDFEKLYRAYAGTKPGEQKHLVGYYERENGGLTWEEPGGYLTNEGGEETYVKGRSVTQQVYFIGGEPGKVKSLPFSPKENKRLEILPNVTK